MLAYYNENDPFAAAWLRELIKAKLIADGEVDERTIVDVRAEDLRGFRQCHFFAGIGVWSYALKCAGWEDDCEVWTGSCPCQPFSAAGSGSGFDDERHLWPHWSRLIGECRPVCVFGEQISSRDGLAWFDFVSADLEAAGYTVGALDTCAAGVGAPHIRQRLYFVADSDGSRCREGGASEAGDGQGSTRIESARFRVAGGNHFARGSHKVSGLADRQRTGLEVLSEQSARQECQAIERNGEISFWSDAEWIYCRDGKYRPAKPGSFPLAHGVAGRVAKLRGIGNALCVPQAQAFIEAYMTTMELQGHKA